MTDGRVEVKQETVEDQKSSATYQLSFPSADFLDLFAATPSIAGQTVSPITAMKVPAVRACVQAIAEALGQLDVNVFETTDGATQKAPDHPVFSLMHDRVNGWTSACEFREQMTRDALLYGNGYAAITRDPDGVPIELNRLQPDRVMVIINPATLEPFYQFTPLNGEAVQYAHGNVLHLRTSSLNGIVGESPISQAREAIGLALIMEGHAARLFAKGARPAASLNVPSKLTPDSISRIAASLVLQLHIIA